MTFNQIRMAIYATFLTNYYGAKLKKTDDAKEKKRLRIEYAKKQLDALDLHIKVINPEKIPSEGQFLLASNHRSVIDPLIIDLAVESTTLFGHWIAKKELYFSLFFGKFVQNAGAILLDRDASKMSGFFSDIKKAVKAGNSIYIFPEGTRNKTDEDVSEFKDGSRIIALKNRLNILPVFIRTQANDALMASLKGEQKPRTIEVEFGDIIDYKDKSMPLEAAYKKQFDLR